MKKRYGVNWSDPPFPKIYRDDEGGVSLSEAKLEIIEHFQYDIDHAKMIIRDTRALRVRDIPTKEDKES